MPDQREERTAVKTYVPAYQKEEWADHAAELDMSLSEFVGSMVQAGRRGFGEEGPGVEDGSGEEPDSSDLDPGGNGLETLVLESLRAEPREFDELVDVVADDLRLELDEVLADLQDRDLVEHDRLGGGYAVVDDE